MGTQIGRCKYCKRTDAVLYVQDAGAHSEECTSCHPLYTAILAHPKRNTHQRGGGRKAHLAALAQLAKAGDGAVVAPVDEAELEIMGKLEAHPLRRANRAGDALLAIRKTLGFAN